MKKTLLITMFLLTVILFCGCNKPLEPSDITFADPYVTHHGTVRLKTQYPEYSPKVSTIRFFIVNESVDDKTYGSQYLLERKDGDTWYKIPFKNTAWNDLAYHLGANGTTSDTVHLSMFDYRFTEGHYRVVKQIEQDYYTAEFDMTADGISDENPYGYEPLEKLPKDYIPEENAVFDSPGNTDERRLQNADIMSRFLYSISNRASDQLRVVRTTVEGDYVIYDIIYEYIFGTPRITLKYDTTRDSYGAKTIETSYYRFITEDKGILYLSNHPTYIHETYESGYPSGAYEFAYYDHNADEAAVYKSLIDYFNTYNKNYITHVGNIYALWSPNGKNIVNHKDSLEYSYDYHPETGGYYGSVMQVENRDGKAIRIIRTIWQNDDEVMLVCETNDKDKLYYEIFNLKNREVTEHGSAVYGEHYVITGEIVKVK